MKKQSQDLSISMNLGSGVSLKLCHIPAAKKRFRMGARGEDPNEEPRHWVGFEEDFWLGETAVTQAQWTALVEKVDLASEIHDLEESRYRGEERGNHPVTNVSWRDCEVLLKRLNKAEALWEVPAQVELSSVPQLCFPTESQWEFACRAGTDTDFYSGDGEAALQRVGWYGQDYNTGSTHSVGMFEENAYGLKDMHGNVWEWCSDKWGNE